MRHLITSSFLLWLGAGLCLLPASNAQAQSRYLKQAAKNAAKTASAETPAKIESAIKEIQLQALQQMRREVVRSPNILQEQNFKIQLELLKKMGIAVPPNANAQTLFAILGAKIEPLAQELNQAVFPLAFPAQSPEKNRPLVKEYSRIDAFKEALKVGQNRFSWQSTANQSVYMGPAKFPKHPLHPLYDCKNLAKTITQNKYASLSQIFDIIFTSHLTEQQKIALAGHLSQTAELAGPELTLQYINLFKTIPAVKMEGWVPKPLGQELCTYARHKQALLIEKLKQGSSWTEPETNLFLDLAALLPAKQSRRVLGALTYLEPSAAQWLLLHPQTNAFTKSIELQIQEARKQGVPTPKLFLKETLPQQLLEERIKVLRQWSIDYTVIADNVRERIESIEFALQHIKTAPQDKVNEPLSLAQQLYVQAYLTRLKKLYTNVFNHHEAIEAELLSLQELTPKVKK